MARHVPKQRWQCAVCGEIELRMPSDCRPKSHYACRGAYQRAHGKSGHAMYAANALRRVMLAEGLSEAEARVWLKGWKRGHRAGRMWQRRAPKVGTAQWEYLHERLGASA